MSLIATENFTGTNGTDITARACDTGQTWSKHSLADSGSPGAFVIENNRGCVNADATANGALDLLNVSLANGNYSVTTTLYMETGGSASYVAIWLRTSSTVFTGYRAQRNAGTHEWHISKTVAGSDTTLATTSGVTGLSAGQTIVVTFSVADHGDGTVDLSLSVNPGGFGAIVITANDATSPITAIGLPAIANAETGTAPSISFDTLEVDGTAGGGGGGSIKKGLYYALTQGMM